MKNIVFDIGNVLVAWDAHAAFRHAFDDATAIEQFFTESDFFAWNLEQDRGRSIAEAIQAAHPDHAPLLAGFFERFPDTIQHKIEGTWSILHELKHSGHRIFGLTNWGAETWPLGLAAHPELAEVFEDTVVSGVEKMIKPQPEIYRLLTQRNGLTPQDCLFIDDSLANVEGARAVGWQAVHFTSPDTLRTELQEHSLL
ncbi:HAD family phosphatase [Lentibacter algarum]|uniref:HAD family hydrolase n=1 Tax=Lentibacter algarum TaxID=576131 RepID=UPI001C068895|nr:HAD family phosphatase [Lentibacter algarum]MBU2980771.1 HAD family phosphatase [Lentibacter algarum]